MIVLRTSIVAEYESAHRHEDAHREGPSSQKFHRRIIVWSSLFLTIVRHLHLCICIAFWNAAIPIVALLEIGKQPHGVLCTSVRGPACRVCLRSLTSANAFATCLVWQQESAYSQGTPDLGLFGWEAETFCILPAAFPVCDVTVLRANVRRARVTCRGYFNSSDVFRHSHQGQSLIRAQMS